MNTTDPINLTTAPSSIHTEQSSIHADLSKIVARHARHPFQKPIALHNQLAFDELTDQWAKRGFPPLILDSGCGVGESTLHIAQAHATTFFGSECALAIDPPRPRNNRDAPVPENLLWLRADVVDFWRLLAAYLAEHGQILRKHYILYPNPYPKIGQLHKRWHGHAVFPTLLRLGGTLEVRSNWDIYIQEFAAATTQLTHQTPEFWGELTNIQAITPFERKYQTRGEHLWGVRFALTA